ncbi:MAG: hypothetical protein LUD27_07040 [Clostridia bacterium]|nr:hypothetical protein [Clostridia bacterium]
MSALAVNILTTISLLWLSGIIGYIIFRIAKMAKDRDSAKLYEFLKSFKKGSCFLVYFAAIPLYFSALYSGGASLGYSIFTAIEKSISLVVLSFDYGAASALIAANAYYAVVIYICYIAVILNAVLFAASLAGMRLMNYIYRLLALKQKKNIYIIVGCNEGNKKIVSSIAKKDKAKGEKGEYSVLIVSDADLKNKDDLNLTMIGNKMAYVACDTDKFGDFLEKKIAAKKLWTNKSVNIIINTKDSETNLLLTQKLSKFIGERDIPHNILNRNGVNGYVFCEPKDSSTFNFYVENTHGAIQYINKYRLVAMDFISKYPLTRYMDTEIDQTFPALKKDVEVNFVMLGFGRQNRQLFHTSVSTQQFMTIDGGKIKEKPVHYCIYDKTESNADLILNHNYDRFNGFVRMNQGRKEEFLPFPEEPADVQFHKMSIRDKSFYRNLYDDLSGENKYSYIVIAFGQDMENLDFGQKICVKLKEWNLKGKVKLFVKIRNNNLVKDVKNDNLIFFGDESRVVYNADAIFHEEIETLAKRRSLLYSEENSKGQSESDLAKQASQKWYKQSQCQRESNIYACLSLKPKLNMLGFDIQKKSDKKGESNDASARFMEKYEFGDPIKYDYIRHGNGRREIIYRNADFEKNSVRKYCAVLEHQRWNANYISWGFVPATIKEIEESPSNGKDFAIRRHGCLTTFEGLKEFCKITAKKKEGAPYEEALEAADVIRYDYQIMDDAVWLLNSCGYEITEKKQ